MLLIFQFSLTELRDSVLIYPNVLSANIAPQKTYCGFLTLGHILFANCVAHFLICAEFLIDMKFLFCR